MKSQSVTIQTKKKNIKMEAIEHYFPVVLRGTIHYVEQGGSNFGAVDGIP